MSVSDSEKPHGSGVQHGTESRCLTETSSSEPSEQGKPSEQQGKKTIEQQIDEILKAAGDNPIAAAQAVDKHIVPMLARLPAIERDAQIAQVAGRVPGVKKPTLSKAVGIIAKENAAREKRELQKWMAEQDEEQRDDLLQAIEAKLEPLFASRKGTATVTFWSVARKEIVHIDIDRPMKVAAMLSMDVGEIEAWVCAILPGLEKKYVTERMTAAMQELAHKSPPRGGLTLLRHGLHVLPDDTALIVDADRIIRARPDGKGGCEFERIGRPVVDGRYYIEQRHEDKRWLPWSLYDLARPAAVGLNDILTHCKEAVGAGWKFREPIDCWLHALLPAALLMSTLWQCRPLFHLRAPHSSGKTTLARDWYSVWCPTALTESNASAAGISAAFEGEARPLIMDEFEGGEHERNAWQDLMRMLRASRTGGSGKLRGTKDQGFNRTKLELACMAASIEPISDNPADDSRWFVTELEHQPDRKTWPMKVALAYLESLGPSCGVEEMRRSLFVGLLAAIPRLRAAEKEIMAKPIPASVASSARWMENLHGLLAVAAVAGMDADRLAVDLLTAHAVDYRAISEDLPGVKLAAAILHSPFQVEDTSIGQGGYKHTERRKTTIAGEIKASPTRKIELRAESGCWTEGEGQNLVLCVNWTTARQTILARTEFGQMSSKRLAMLAKQVKGHRADRGHDSGFGNFERFQISQMVDGLPMLSVVKGEGSDLPQSFRDPSVDNYGESDEK